MIKLNLKNNINIVYTIKNGDNLYSIANNYNISVKELIDCNEKGSTFLHIGDKLLIPKKEVSENITYIVKHGDTLYNLARRFNVDMNTLTKINNLKNNNLQIGIKLIIPK